MAPVFAEHVPPASSFGHRNYSNWFYHNSSLLEEQMCFNTNEEKENINLMIRLDLKLNGVTALFDSQKLKLL